jgi:V/A-type H+-transporting ATPase subunit C|tara:strand:- start:2764 stop:3819 length:1056 start_codon:yes stop_codon:yes gene_type:complete
MNGIVSGRSNIYNAAARAKARKASLIESTRMRQLLQLGPESIGASIAELGYRNEMDIYSARLSGADAVEAALFHNLDNDLSEVMRFCQGPLKSIVAIYVERFSYEKAKTVLRAVNGGCSDELIESQILPSENPRNLTWLEIVRSTETVAEAANAMVGTPWGKELGKLEGSDPTLEDMEDALDRQYYSHALKVSKGKGSNIHLMKYIKTEIDHRNIINQFRELRQNISPEKRSQMVILGGRIHDSLMIQASQATSQEAIIDTLRRSKSFDDEGFDEAIQQSNATGSLDPIASLLTHKRHAMLRSFAYLNPVSAFPVIYYIERKVLEIQNLRLLVRGKTIGLSSEVLEAHMDF